MFLCKPTKSRFPPFSYKNMKLDFICETFNFVFNFHVILSFILGNMYFIVMYIFSLEEAFVEINKEHTT